ncbi:MAG TPA: ABC transporter permease [Dehalococcoidia bacterium]|nr:ABC transporter permease [Dehalococcoidia bacterium]
MAAEGAFSPAWYRPLLHFVRGKPLGTASAVVLALMVLIAVLAPLLSPFDPLVHDNAYELQGPSSQHVFGTDQYGRDVLSRIIYGARTSLYVGTGATLLGIGLAVVIGTASAYFGGAFDYAVQRVVDTVQAIPALILLITILVILGPSLTNVIIALSIRSAMVTSRVVRGSALAVLAQPFIDAGRLLGASHQRLIGRYIVPNIMAPVIVLASINFGGNILAEASLSFLGYGVPPPTASWGGMLSAEGRAYMFAAPWLLIAPTVVLTLVVFASNMFGDALRDVLDPRLRGAGNSAAT